MSFNDLCAFLPVLVVFLIVFYLSYDALVRYIIHKDDEEDK